jgi:hypothetical protein
MPPSLARAPSRPRRWHGAETLLGSAPLEVDQGCVRVRKRPKIETHQSVGDLALHGHDGPLDAPSVLPHTVPVAPLDGFLGPVAPAPMLELTPPSADRQRHSAVAGSARRSAASADRSATRADQDAANTHDSRFLSAASIGVNIAPWSDGRSRRTLGARGSDRRAPPVAINSDSFG